MSVSCKLPAQRRVTTVKTGLKTGNSRGCYNELQGFADPVILTPQRDNRFSTRSEKFESRQAIEWDKDWARKWHNRAKFYCTSRRQDATYCLPCSERTSDLGQFLAAMACLGCDRSHLFTGSHEWRPPLDLLWIVPGRLGLVSPGRPMDSIL